METFTRIGLLALPYMIAGLIWLAIFAMCFKCAARYMRIRPAHGNVPAKIVFRRWHVPDDGYTAQERKENAAFEAWVSKYEAKQKARGM